MLFTLDVLCLWVMVSIKRLLQLSPFHPSHLPGFYQTFLLFYKQYFVNILFWSDCCKKLFIFKVNYFFSINLLVLILLFCVYVFLRTLFQSSAIKTMNSFIFAMCIASYLVSHQIMLHKQKNWWPCFENYKLLKFFRFLMKLSSRSKLPP